MPQAWVSGLPLVQAARFNASAELLSLKARVAVPISRSSISQENGVGSGAALEAVNVTYLSVNSSGATAAVEALGVDGGAPFALEKGIAAALTLTLRTAAAVWPDGFNAMSRSVRGVANVELAKLLASRPRGNAAKARTILF